MGWIQKRRGEGWERYRRYRWDGFRGEGEKDETDTEEKERRMGSI